MSEVSSVNGIFADDSGLGRTVSAGRLPYFSFTTLTTLGYGDIVAVRPTARMLTTLEAAGGVLYVAITMARLVAWYQATGREDQVG